MTLILTPLAEARLRALAAQNGQAPEDVIETLLQREMPAINRQGAPGYNPLIALFNEWDREDQTDDPEELSRRNREWEETKANLAANRLTLRNAIHLLPHEEIK